MTSTKRYRLTMAAKRFIPEEAVWWRSWPLALLIVIALVLRLYRLGSQSLWFDETYTAMVAQMPYARGLEFLVADGVHPPLFYWIEKSFLSLAQSEWMVRLPAMLFGVLGVGMTYVVGEEWLGGKGGIMAALLLALAPFHLWYSQEARMYTLLALLSLSSMWAYTRILKRPSKADYIIFVLANGLAYATHYFGLFLPYIQFIHLVIFLKRYHQRLRVWVGLQALAALPILAWAYRLSQREGQYFGIGWISQPGLSDLLYTLANFTIGYIPPVSLLQWAIVAGLAMLVVWGNMRRIIKDRPDGVLLTLWAFMPMVMILLISMRRPTYVDRFLILSLPAFLVLMAEGISSLDRRWMGLAGVLVVAILSWRSIEVLKAPEALRKEEWRQAGQYLNEKAGKDEIVVLRTLQIAVPMQYYLDDDVPVEALQVNREVRSLEGIASGYNGAWLVYWNASAHAHALASQGDFEPAAEEDPAAARWISGGGPEILERVDFEGVTLFHFEWPR